MAVFATLVSAGLVSAKSVKKGGPFDVKGLVGVTIWGATATLLTTWDPTIGATMAALMMVDVLVLKSAGPTGAELLGGLIVGGSAKAGPQGAVAGFSPIGGQPTAADMATATQVEQAAYDAVIAAGGTPAEGRAAAQRAIDQLNGTSTGAGAGGAGTHGGSKSIASLT